MTLEQIYLMHLEDLNEQLKAELARLQAENAALKAAKTEGE